MAGIADRPKSALLVIDVQNDVVAPAHDRDAVVANIAAVVRSARAASTPVIWVQHEHDTELPRGSQGWQIVDDLQPDADEPVVHKRYRNAFESTELESLLEARQVGRLIVTGSQSDYCVRWTLHGAHDRGYDTVLVADGHTTDAESDAGLPTGAALIAHTNAVWASLTAPAADASVVAAADLEW